MAAESDPVGVHPRSLHERLHHPVRCDDRADRGVRRGEAFRDRHQIGPDVVELRAEPRAEAAEAGNDLVGAEQDVVAVAQLTDAAPVPLRRRECTAGVLHRLEDHHRNRLRACGLDRLLQLVEQEGGELRLTLFGWAVIAVRVANMVHSGHERLERLTDRRDPVDRKRTHRRPVIRDVVRDRLPPAARALLKSLHRIEVDDGSTRCPGYARRESASRPAPRSTGAPASRPTPRPRSRLRRRRACSGHPGASEATSDASSIARGWAYDQFV